ncbi:H-type lectin domain-containing protein [Escherichia coli]|nr:H-type lectin domain-containing protein [Escherichia coli]MCP3506808.1 H-type lectin domain-containing protein [Escherichia coli]
MFHVDNSTGVPVMPQPSPVTSETELFFTEGGNGVPPTYPGPDWFNVIQSELLNILKAAGIDPDKMDNTQILVALKKLFLSRSNPFGDIKADGAAAIAAALTNLGLGEAAKRNVGTGANQIPDMSLFASSNTATAAAQKFPSGLILQCGMLNSPPNASSTYGMTFPMTFSRVLAVVVTLNVTGASGQPTVSATNIHNTGFDITVSPGSVYGASSDAYYIAMGY